GHADVDRDGAGALAEVDVAADGAEQEDGLTVGDLAGQVDGLAADAQVVAGGVDLGVLEHVLDGPVGALEHELLDLAGHADVDRDGAGALAEVDVAADGAEQEDGLTVGDLAGQVDGLAADAQVVAGGVDLGVLEHVLDGPVGALEHELLDLAGHADVDRDGAGALAEVDVAADGAEQEDGLTVGDLAGQVDGLAADAQVVAGGVDLGVLEHVLDGPVGALEHKLLDVAGHADVDRDGPGALTEVDVAADGAKQQDGLAVGDLAGQVDGLAADAQVVAGGVDLGVLEHVLDGPVGALEHKLLDVAG